MLRRRLPLSSPWHSLSLCLTCASRSHFRLSPLRSFSSNAILESRKNEKSSESGTEPQGQPESEVKETRAPTKKKRVSKQDVPAKSKRKSDKTNKLVPGLSIKDSLLGVQGKKASKNSRKPSTEFLQIEILSPRDLDFESVDVPLPPVPMLGYGLDRVLFNPGVYRLQDPRSRVYNFDPYLEKIMPVKEFNFNALEEYKTSSKDESLIAMTKRLDTKFTGSTSSMSGILKHFHYLLSNFRPLNHKMLSRDFPNPSPNFSQITLGPDAVLLRWKDGVYAMDADKAYDSPNIMSWLGNSLEKLLTSDRSEFERYRRSSPEGAPPADISGKCFHYSKLGSILMRSQLDAYDPRLPGSGIFDLKTRAVVSIRMNKNHSEYETGLGYQLRFDNGEWESYEREFYDMTRATLLKYSLQVRMGRMDGIFVAYHNVERLFGFQYLSKQDMDDVLHGQQDTCLGDQEFKLSISLLEELMKRATAHFPNTSLRLHVEARKTPFLYFFAEPVTEEQAEEIQNSSHQLQKEFERNIVGVQRDDAEVQAAFHDIQGRVNEQFDEDETKTLAEEVDEEESEDEKGTESDDDFRGGPLMGWTLTVRSQVNGRYVSRPQNLEPEDDWTIEYHIKEIAPEARWGLYNRLKERRRKLIGLEARENMRGMSFYDSLIQKYTDKGREWRASQDKVDEEIGQKVYKRLGPGSDATS